MNKIQYFILSILICGFINLQAVDYSEIQPIFTANCTMCHGGSHGTGLDLTSYASVMAGSNSGPVITAGNHSSSLLWQRINDEEMPPSGDALSPSKITSIASWIDEGALEQPLGVTKFNIIPDNIMLNSIYPNPFNPSATISWEQLGAENVQFSIFNLKGELTEEFSFENSQPGFHTLNWHPSGLPAGVYLVRLTGKTFSSTQKAIYLK